MSENKASVVRIAEQKDKSKYKELWKICFGDSDAFCDWFFEHRFSPAYSVVLEENEEIPSCMQAFPYTVQIRGENVAGAMLCGVSTHPDHRKKGYMGKIFTFEMNHLRDMGCAVAVHTPAVLPSYFSFGHLPVADAAYLSCNVIPSQKLSGNISIISEKDWNILYPLYSTFSKKYSGIIQRTEEDFMRKAADYAADGGKAIAYIENDRIRAYAFYYQTDTKLISVEAVAEDGYWAELMHGLFAIGTGLKFSAKLPPEVKVSFPFAEMKQVTKGVMGLCDVTALLKALKLDIPYGFKIRDHVVPENNGHFNFYGEHYDKDPVFEISAGHLLQVLVGYHTLEELKNDIVVYDEVKFAEINACLPKQECYIIDEY